MADQLVGDLSSFPDPARTLWDEEVWAMDFLLTRGDLPVDQISNVRTIIAHRTDMLAAELRQANPFLDRMVKSQVHHQLRVRPDFRREELCVEQWIPALRHWKVCGYFPNDTPAADIIYQLQRGDPRFKSATEAYEESRAQAARNRAALDAANDQKVLDAVNSLSSARRDQFIAVEEALKTGETIMARGDDRRAIERGIELTQKAARSGEVEAQDILTNHGRMDNPMCLNPGQNPLVDRGA